MDFFLLVLLVLNKKLLLKQCNKAITATTKPTNCFIEAKEEEDKVAQKRKGIIQLIEIKCITLNLKAKKKITIEKQRQAQNKSIKCYSCNKVSTSLNINIYYER